MLCEHGLGTLVQMKPQRQGTHAQMKQHMVMLRGRTQNGAVQRRARTIAAGDGGAGGWDVAAAAVGGDGGGAGGGGGGDGGGSGGTSAVSFFCFFDGGPSPLLARCRLAFAVFAAELSAVASSCCPAALASIFICNSSSSSSESRTSIPFSAVSNLPFKSSGSLSFGCGRSGDCNASAAGSVPRSVFMATAHGSSSAAIEQYSVAALAAALLCTSALAAVVSIRTCIISSDARDVATDAGALTETYATQEQHSVVEMCRILRCGEKICHTFSELFL